MTCIIDPMISFELIKRDAANACLVAWGHKMGPNNRPEFGKPVDFGMRHNGELVAVVCSDQLIRPTCKLDRSRAFELSRLCASTPHLCQPALRLWREFAFPVICRAWGTTWAISYQDARRHRGGIYRWDGWGRLGWSRSGTDKRSACGTVAVRNKVIWGWTADRQELQARIAAAAQMKWPKWAGLA